MWPFFTLLVKEEGGPGRGREVRSDQLVEQEERLQHSFTDEVCHLIWAQFVAPLNQ